MLSPKTQGYVNRGQLAQALEELKLDLERGLLNPARHPLTAPTGTGFRYVIAGVEEPAAKLVDTADVSNAAITYAKIQNVAADRLLGRGAGAGVVAEITCTADARTLLAASASANIPDPAGGGVIDVEARAALVLILNLLEAKALMSP